MRVSEGEAGRGRWPVECGVYAVAEGAIHESATRNEANVLEKCVKEAPSGQLRFELDEELEYTFTVIERGGLRKWVWLNQVQETFEQAIHVVPLELRAFESLACGRVARRLQLQFRISPLQRAPIAFKTRAARKNLFAELLSE